MEGRRSRFRALHERDGIFVMPNPWDVGSANLLASIAELASAGVRRVSTGGALARAAYGALLSGAQELRDAGTSRYSALGAPMEALRAALGGG